MMNVDDWATIEATFPYVDSMRNCIQDPVHHAEGDVLTHTKMVMEALAQFDCDDRIMRLVTLYHDCCKPQTRTVEWDSQQQRDCVRHPFHAVRGAEVAWHDLWLADEPLETRLAVYWLCRWHQKVFHVWQTDIVRSALQFASVGSWPQLIKFAMADNTGRICSNADETMESLLLLHEFMTDRAGGRRFDGDFFNKPHDRVFYSEKNHRSPYFEPPDPVGSRVIVLSGLPGVGKDHYCATVLDGWPVVSLDRLREQMDVDPEDNQGQVRQAALEQARVHLRAKTNFVWNATCISRMNRDAIIRLCRQYDAYVSIHAFDRPLKTVLRQNRERDQVIPDLIILSLAKKWEPPSLLEAHDVLWV